MTLTPEMNALIEQKMAELDKDSLLRPGMAYNDFVTDYTGLIAQAVKDLVMLEAAGFDGSQMELYAAYLQKLIVEHGERVVMEGDVTESETAFDERMPKARKDKQRLMAMGRCFLQTGFRFLLPDSASYEGSISIRCPLNSTYKVAKESGKWRT